MSIGGKKKHSQEFIENEFIKRDCKLLDIYKNKNTAMKFLCKCGNESTITYGSFRRGSHCLKCSGKQKYTIDEIKMEFSKRGCELLEDVYVNAITKMKAACKCGDVIYTSWNNLQQGRDCLKCGVKKRLEKTRKEKHYNWIKDREEAKIRRRFSSWCRSHLNRALKQMGGKKQDKTYEMLGYNARELQHYIVNHKNWHQVKNYVWHMDHIFPVKAFNDYGVLDPKLINCFDNLQPIKKEDNFKKNAKYNKIEFKDWLLSKGVII